MATPKAATAQPHLISRTYRAAIRLGEDFVTLEETITLPIDATDEEIGQAVDLGWRIFTAQRAAAEEQVSEIRAGMPPQPSPIRMRDPDAPASGSQRNYIASLQAGLSWNSEQLATYAEEQSIDLVTMTKAQASVFIDSLKALAQGAEPVRQVRPAASRAMLTSVDAPAEQRRGAIGRVPVVASQEKGAPPL